MEGELMIKLLLTALFISLSIQSSYGEKSCWTDRHGGRHCSHTATFKKKTGSTPTSCSIDRYGRKSCSQAAAPSSGMSCWTDRHGRKHCSQEATSQAPSRELRDDLNICNQNIKMYQENIRNVLSTIKHMDDKVREYHKLVEKLSIQISSIDSSSSEIANFFSLMVKHSLWIA